MFKELRMEGRLTCTLEIKTPLLIKSGDSGSLDPTLPDMSFVRTMREGVPTIYIPGSSLKGVLRTRVEQIAKACGKEVCNAFESGSRCRKGIRDRKFQTGEDIYRESCTACRMFGSTNLGGRFHFPDVYPIPGTVQMGTRHGVGINRRTGAAYGGAKYLLEVAESGAFEFCARFENTQLGHIRLLLYAIQDIADGYVTLGMGGSRGLGMFTIDEATYQLTMRDFREEPASVLRGYYEDDTGGQTTYEHCGLYWQTCISGLQLVEKALPPVKSVIGV